MPSGRTHDRITLWSLPWVGGATLVITQSSRLTLIVAGGFLLGGLMFGPDLDIYSRQYQRWGWLKWIWLPYRKLLKHRSFWSHGFVVGTTLRLLYFTACVGLAVATGFGVTQLLLGLIYPEAQATVDWPALLLKVQQGFQQYPI
ncbi:MAG: metal-binding protein, partial [Leptolyngbyaceae bacterium]|nr:metal-binding protein [Leptolyngbyaceae bacterium]